MINQISLATSSFILDVPEIMPEWNSCSWIFEPNFNRRFPRPLHAMRAVSLYWNYSRFFLISSNPPASYNSYAFCWLVRTWFDWMFSLIHTDRRWSLHVTLALGHKSHLFRFMCPWYITVYRMPWLWYVICRTSVFVQSPTSIAQHFLAINRLI